MIVNSQAKVCAIIITFHPDLPMLGRLLDRLTSQVEWIVIIDNSEIKSLELKEIVRKNFGRVHLIRMESNAGVAAAQNRGIGWARNKGFTFVLLVDQDSIPAPDMISKLMEAYNILTSMGTALGAVGPKYIDQRSGHSPFFVRFGKFRIIREYCSDTVDQPYIPVDFLISSGMLLPISAVEAVGDMDEGLFIDNIDMDWCFRAKKKGLKLFGICSAMLQHRLGDKVRKIWFGRWRYVHYHPPIRQYYMMRNRILLYKRPYTPKRWIVQDFVRLLFKFVLFSFLIPPRYKNAMMMIRGIVDGLQTKSGKLAVYDH